MEERHKLKMFGSVLLLITIFAYCTADVVRIGPNILPIVTTIENSAGSTFLMNDVVLHHGVLFAFSAFFVNISRVHFQVWRPYHRLNDTGFGAMFKLVFQAAMTPSVTLSREDFYIASTLKDRCPVVQSGDTVGVFFESSPTAISRFFNPVDAAAYRNQLQNLSVPTQVNDVVVFDTLRFPYKLNLQAWIDTSNDSLPLDHGNSTENDYVDCPMVLIPSRDVESITIGPGATGATGPTGPSGNTGPAGDTGPFGMAGETGPVGPIGSTGVRGIEGATGASGPFGVIGEPGPGGQMGATGPIGETGVEGQIGPVGPPGPPGTSAPMDNKAASASDGCNGFLMSEDFLIGMIIWLCLLSLLLLTILVIVIVLCIEYRSKRKKVEEETSVQPWKEAGSTYPRQDSQNDYRQGGLATDPRQSRMKEETESNFSLDTIETAFDRSGTKARKSDDSAYAILHDPSATSISDGGVYNPVYTDLDAPENGQLNDLTHDTGTSS